MLFRGGAVNRNEHQQQDAIVLDVLYVFPEMKESGLPEPKIVETAANVTVVLYNGKTANSSDKPSDNHLPENVSVSVLPKAVEDLFPFNSLNYEKLSGDKAGIESVRVNDKYRLEFQTERVEGEVIKDELIARGISQKDFAERIGVPYTMLNDILNERRPLSAATALFIESALGISAELLMGLQSDYTMQHTRNDAECPALFFPCRTCNGITIVWWNHYSDASAINLSPSGYCG